MISLGSTIKKIIARGAQNDLIWSALDKTLLKLTRYAEWQRGVGNPKSQTQIERDYIRQLCPDLVVKNGPFKGMRYPGMGSVGSNLFPKLLGSYEAEIQPVMEKICEEKYAEIVDVGCAEGYYAVGLAMRLPAVKVYAYDRDKRAVRLCRRMAELNGVAERVFVRGACDVGALKSLSSTGRGLIISDCEGFEKELFTEAVARLFSRHDFLIETHDFIDITISTLIRRRFEKTHDIEVIPSLDDIKKAQTYVYKELDGCDLAVRKLLLREGRPAIMEWFYMKSKP